MYGRRYQRKRGFKRVVVTLLSFVMLISICFPGLRASAEDEPAADLTVEEGSTAIYNGVMYSEGISAPEDSGLSFASSEEGILVDATNAVIGTYTVTVPAEGDAVQFTVKVNASNQNETLFQKLKAATTSNEMLNLMNENADECEKMTVTELDELLNKVDSMEDDGALNEVKSKLESLKKSLEASSDPKTPYGSASGITTYAGGGGGGGTTPPGQGGAADEGTFTHIEIEVKAIATAVINGTTVSETINVTVDDAKNLITITAKQDGVELSDDEWSWTGSKKGDGDGNGDTVELTGSYPSGTYDSPVEYTITMTKTVTFTVEGKSYEVPVTFTTTTSYWDSNNHCPGVINNSNWLAGKFAQNGIDTPFGSSNGLYDDAGDIQITKEVKGVTPTTDTDFTFQIYQQQNDGSYVLYDTVTLTISANSTSNMAIFTLAKVPTGVYVVTESGYPSEIDGYSFTNVTYSNPTDDNSTINGSSITVEENKIATVTATNTYAAATGSLTLTKVLIDETHSTEQTFNLTLAPAEEEDIDLVDWADSNGYDISDGVVIIPITVGAESSTNWVTLTNLPAGTYVVGETGASNYNVIGVGEVIVAGGTTAESIVTNTLKTASITLDKIVDGNMGNRLQEFTFTVKVNGIVKQTVKLSDGSDIITINNIPAGAMVSITESDNSGYDVSVTVSNTENENFDSETSTVSFIAIADTTHDVVFTNYNGALIDTGIITESTPFIFLFIVAFIGTVALLLNKRRYTGKF